MPWRVCAGPRTGMGHVSSLVPGQRAEAGLSRAARGVAFGSPQSLVHSSTFCSCRDRERRL